MNDELKPCPFCGRKVKIRIVEDMFYIDCFKCDINIGRRHENRVIDKWNTRKSADKETA